MPDLPSIDDVMGRIEGEETRRLVMGPQKIEDLEAKAMVTIRQNPNLRLTFQGNNAPRCEYCKKEGHNKEYWYLHPHLRPKGGFKKGGGDLEEPIRGKGKIVRIAMGEERNRGDLWR
jgi:hypothetical protein